MNRYTYCPIQYVHDPTSGEALNVGVLIYSPEAEFVDLKIEPRFGRLSGAFADFQGQHYGAVRLQLQRAVLRLERDWWGVRGPSLAPGFGLPDDVEGVMNGLLLDRGLSLQPGPARSGVAENLEDELGLLYELKVARQFNYDRPARRNDEQVWAAFQPDLDRHRITSLLRPHIFEESLGQLELEYTFEADGRHVIRPLSLDYIHPEGIRDKAVHELGTAWALNSDPAMGTLFLLIGAPLGHRYPAQYALAREMLAAVPVEHEIIEESGAANFAEYLEATLVAKGVLPNGKEPARAPAEEQTRLPE